MLDTEYRYDKQRSSCFLPVAISFAFTSPLRRNEHKEEELRRVARRFHRRKGAKQEAERERKGKREKAEKKGRKEEKEAQ